MADQTGVFIVGLREKVRALESAGVDAAELKEPMAEVAATAADVMQAFVPIRSGRLRKSVRGNRAKAKAVVTIGSARVPYAKPINYGWASRGIRPANYVAKTDDVMGTRAVEILDAGWSRIAERHGLT